MSEADALEEARETIRQLQEAFASFDVSLAADLGLTVAERHIFGCLYRREGWVTFEQLSALMCSIAPTREPPARSTLAVHVMRIRRKVQPWGGLIENSHGSGYRMSAETRSAVSAMLTAKAAGAA